MLGYQDLRNAYRRSSLGQFWITASMAVQIATIGIVFSVLFKSDPKLYLPYLATSLIIWALFSGVLSEGCLSFIAAEPMIKQLQVPYLTYIFRVVWRNLLTMAHNIVILPVLFLALGHKMGFESLLFFPGLLLVVANAVWVVWLLAIVSARFRDVPQIVAAALTVVFYVTPVIWQPAQLGNGTFAHVLLGYNPIYHWLQVVRLPLLGGIPTTENWLISIFTLIVGGIVALFVKSLHIHRIAYWV